MLYVMIESHETPGEDPADAGAPSESGVNLSGAASQESGSDPQSIAEQRAPTTLALLEPRLPQLLTA